MGVYQEISGLTAGQLYEFQASFRLATNVESGMIGVGGSPGRRSMSRAALRRKNRGVSQTLSSIIA